MGVRGRGRGPRRLVAGVLGVVFTTSAWCVTAPSARAADDYPWAWQGQCPILPQQPIEPEATPTSAPGSPTPGPGTAGPGTPAPGTPGPGEAESQTPPPPPPPPPPPVLDPVSGHLYDPRGPRPTCERNVWFVNGSMGDQWGFALRNCTSFVAWRLNRTNGMTFENRPSTNDDRGEHGVNVHWGDARNWDDTARALGYRVDGVPAIGAVAQTDEGRVGHVAWVVGIGPGTVTIEEYNHAVAGGYGTRTVPVGAFRYLHLRDVAPSPLIGSTRPLVAAQDGQGDSWTARVDDSGTLLISRPRARVRVVGARRSFSPFAAPSLVLDDSGRPWVAATTRAGGLVAGTLGRRGWTLRRVGEAAPTSSPALVVSDEGRPTVIATSTAGTLAASQRRPDGRWSRPRRIGEPGSWATHSAPVTGTDSTGRTWLVAMTRHGRLFVQHSLRHDRGWSRLRALPGPRASVTSTPSLTLDPEGVLHLHQTGYDGVVAVRSLTPGATRVRTASDLWTRPRALEGEWSPYSSPAVREMGGQLQLAAVTPEGRLLVRPALPGARSRLRQVAPRPADPTRSPALVTRSNFGVFVISTDGRRQAATLVLRPASAVTGDDGPTRAGLTP